VADPIDAAMNGQQCSGFNALLNLVASNTRAEQLSPSHDAVRATRQLRDRGRFCRHWR
jgi:hypothetical protein